MKSLFGKPDTDEFTKQMIEISNQKYYNKKRLDSIQFLLKQKDKCTLHLIELDSISNQIIVQFTENIAQLFRNFSKKTDEELVEEIYEEMSMRHLMGDFDA